MLKLNDRFELPVLPVTTEAPTPKVKAKRKPRTKPVAPAADPIATTTSTAPPHNSAVKVWAAFGVSFTLILSAALNGYANAQHAPAAFAGWLMGLAVPVLVLVLSKVCGEKFRAGQKPVAWFAGGSGVSLLVLSVWHCSEAIALLTGSPVALALPLAVAIDAGLVACRKQRLHHRTAQQTTPQPRPATREVTTMTKEQLTDALGRRRLFDLTEKELRAALAALEVWCISQADVARVEAWVRKRDAEK